MAIAARIPITTTTITSSIRVNPFRRSDTPTPYLPYATCVAPRFDFIEPARRKRLGSGHRGRRTTSPRRSAPSSDREDRDERGNAHATRGFWPAAMQTPAAPSRLEARPAASCETQRAARLPRPSLASGLHGFWPRPLLRARLDDLERLAL